MKILVGDLPWYGPSFRAHLKDQCERGVFKPVEQVSDVFVKERTGGNRSVRANSRSYKVHSGSLRSPSFEFRQNRVVHVKRVLKSGGLSRSPFPPSLDCLLI